MPSVKPLISPMSNEAECCSSIRILSSILVIFILVGGIFVLMYLRLPQPTDQSVSSSQASASHDLHTAWMSDIRSILSDLSASTSPADIDKMRDKVLALRVAGSDRDTHLQLVLLLGDMERGDVAAFGKIESILGSLE